MIKKIHLDFSLSAEHRGLRLDNVVTKLLPDYSRGRIQQWIKSEHILLNGAAARQRDIVDGNETIHIRVELADETPAQAQSIPLNICYEDAELLVIDKPPGLVVHPGAGNPDQTLVNALLYHDDNLRHLPRAGVVHRLDKNTSGLMVVAKTLSAHHFLVQAIQQRAVKRQYIAIVNGSMIAGGTINAAIGRHPKNRIKMAVVANGKPAVTHFTVREKFKLHTAVDVTLESGRTHQIRVHFSNQQHPLIGDILYGYRPYLPKQATPNLQALLRHFPRQALHATALTLPHPTQAEPLHITSPLPEDLVELVEALRET